MQIVGSTPDFIKKNLRVSLAVCFLASTVSHCSVLLQSCLTLCHPMDYSAPGFPVHHQLLELAQTYVHRVGDAIQPSYPL